MIALGIDLGTTKCAAVLFDTDRRLCLASQSQVHHAGSGNQSIAAILEAAIAAIRRLPEPERRRAEIIGLTGQMHGVLCWGGQLPPKFENWQSTLAASSGTLDRIRQLPGCRDLAAGYGFATLAVPGWSDGYRHAATLPDYFAALLADAAVPVTEATNAASWGLWQLDRRDWDRAALSRLGIRPELLPVIVPSGFRPGNLCRTWAARLGLPAGIPVKVPIGDNPAALLGSGGNWQTDAYLTIGTGAQLALIPQPEELEQCSTLELRPFPHERLLAVAAPLCGGKAIEVLAAFVRELLAAFAVTVPDGVIYETISARVPAGPEPPLQVCTILLGERRQPERRGSISNLGPDNFHFRTLCRAWGNGLLDSLLENIPEPLLRRRRRLLVNGNAVRRSPLLQELIRERLHYLEIILPDTSEEAACGAAIS